MARSKSSARWLRRHFTDSYVRKAHQTGCRSRAAFKLEEINARERILRPGMTVVDLGAAPGGWAQMAANIVGAHGRVIALDILAMAPLAGVEFVQGDFADQETLQGVLDLLAGRPVDLVISDMAPNISGMKAVDQPRAMYLAELALDFARRVLVADGHFLVKIFQGEGVEAFRAELRRSFRSLVTCKPKASRPGSREVYILARNYIVS